MTREKTHSSVPFASTHSHNLIQYAKSEQKSRQLAEKWSGRYKGEHKHPHLQWKCEQALRQQAVCLGMSL